MIGLLAVQFFIPSHKGVFAAQAYTVTNRETWEQGTNSNVDTESVYGDVRVAPAGSWSARSWKTPPDSLTLGVAFTSDGTDIYVLRGNADAQFWKYTPASNSWTVLTNAPVGAYLGSHLEMGAAGTVYAIFGNYNKKFYKYTILTNAWTELSDTPDITGPGSSLGWNGTNLYLLRGNTSQDFWSYDTGTNEWSILTGPPGTIGYGADLLYDGSANFYTLRGAGTNGFYRYTVGGSWSTMTTNYPTTINETTHSVYSGGAIYIQHGVATTTFYKCTISALTCTEGAAWGVLATFPSATRYAGLAYHSGDGYLYSFRGNGTYDLWKYNIAANSFIGTTPSTAVLGTGSDLIWDGSNTVYGFQGGNTANFYAYSISGNSWSAKTSTGLGALNSDIKAVKAGDYIYAFQGGNTNFYRYNTTNDAGGWSALTAAPAAIGNGASLTTISATSDYIYALRGGGNLDFYAYSIANNNWTTFNPTDLTSGFSCNIGCRLVSDGTDIYAMLGIGATSFYKYTYAAGGGTWAKAADPGGRVPFSPYYGSDLTYYNGKIYASAGYYKDKLYEYTVATRVWRRLPNIQTQYLYDIGPYNGASLEYIGSNSLLLSRGTGYTDILSYTLGAANYQTSGIYTSPSIDMTYVASWVSLTTSQSTPGDSTIAITTRTSADGTTWTDWQSLSGENIQSSANRYIQVKATLTASSDQSQTPTLSSYVINYNTDTTDPSNPAAESFACTSRQIGGTALVSGSSYSHSHPYCTWSAGTDAESGVVGYYVYFGTNGSAEPETDGVYQTAAAYVSNEALTTGTYYLLVKTKDNSGNVTDSARTGFTYVYNGVSPPQTVTKTLTADFNAGTLSNLTSASDKLKLTGKSGFWKEGRLSTAPAGLGYGGSVVYKSSIGASGTLYVARGANTNTFWAYDIAADTWSVKTSTGLGTVNYGGGIVDAPGNYIYAIRGGDLSGFYRYDVTNDAAGWVDADAEEAPTAFGYGGSLVYDGSRYIYALRGASDDVFYRFDPQTTADGQWTSLTNVDFGSPNQSPNNLVNNGGSLAYDGANTIYATQGSLYPGGFSKYSISGNSWTPLGGASTPTAMLPNSPGHGASLAWDSTTSKLYYIQGNSLPRMYKFDPSLNTWTAVNPGPSTFGYGCLIQPINGTFYILRGNGAANFYKYNTAKDYWYVPAYNLFGPNWYGTSYFTTYYGAGIVKGDSSNFYMMRGYYDNIFSKYNPDTGTITELTPLPEGSFNGGTLVYESTNNAIYATVGDPERALFKYDIATNVWTEESQDLPPTQPGYGASMVYDGTRYIYYARGANTTTWYRYDTQASAGSRWSTALPTTNLGGQGYGSEFVYKDGYIYTLRGQNVNPNPLYRFQVSALPTSAPWTGSWEVLTSLSAPVYNDGFLVDGQDGYLYASAAGNHATYGNDWWRYNLSTPGWTQVADVPATVYVGGSGASNGTNKIYAFSGPGTNSWSDGLYTYVVETDDSSFEETGTYTSQSLDLTSVYAWANVTVNYTSASNTTVTVETQSSSDNSTWSSLVAASQLKTTGNARQYAINSNTARYLKVKITVTSGDGVLSPTINDWSVNYYQDTTAAANPTQLSSAKSQASGGVDITDSAWYNYAQPYFTWPAANAANGAADNTGGSGVAGYYMYFGAAVAGECTGTPGTTAGLLTPNEGLLYYQTATNFTVPTGIISSGNTYCLRMAAKDNAGNVQGTPWQTFKYKYDTTVPSNPASITVNPVGYTSIDSYTFTISGAGVDADSNLLKYQYRTGGDASNTWYDFSPALSTSVTLPNDSHAEGKYQSGANQFYYRVVDIAGNASTPINVQYYFGNEAPSLPTSLTAVPSSGSTNSFTFEWSAPAAFIGNADSLKYYYSVNALPTAYNTASSYTTANAIGPSAFATQKGENIFYVVAEDAVGNINWSNYAQVTFTANTSDPPAPLSVNISDISDKKEELDPSGDSGEYRTVISWSAPETIPDEDNFNGYKIYFSTTATGAYTALGTTLGTAYVHIDLTKDQTYYYYVTSIDKTDGESVKSNDPAALPDPTNDMPHEIASGKFKYAPAINPNPDCDKSAIVCDTDKKVKLSAGARTSTLYWSTTRNARPEVQYGLSSSSLDKTAAVSRGATTSFHEVLISNLNPETKYFYRVAFTDIDGNSGYYPPLIESPLYFTTTQSPKVSTLKVKNVGLYSMEVEWKSSVESHGSVKYRGSTEPLSKQKTIEESSSNFSTDHNVTLTDLSSETTYIFQVSAQDRESNKFESDEYTQDTLKLPKIKDDLKAENRTEVDVPTVTVGYESNIDITTVIKYTPAGGAAKTYVSLDKTTKHSAELSGLLPKTPYILEVTGSDAYGNEAAAKTFQITTESDTMPPRIVSLTEKKRVIGEGAGAEAQLTVKVASNEPTTLRVEASEGIQTSKFDITSNEDPLNIDHTVTLKLKEAGKTYSYRVVLKDQTGNESISEIKTIVVQKANKTAFEYTLSIFARSFGWLSEMLK